MARKGLVESNNRKEQLIDRFSDRRLALKNKMKKATTLQEILEIQGKLQSLPRNASPVRHRRRCIVTGRPRGVYRCLGNMSRVVGRQSVAFGFLAGWKRSSW
jgi:small subunit ribosomal protein S14